MTTASVSEIAAGKTTHTYLARQPIYDRRLKVTAYELLYRSGIRNEAVVSDGDRATGEVVFNAVTEIGLEQVVGQGTAFINVTPAFLLGGHCEALPKDRVVLEVLEDIEPTPEIIEALLNLWTQGYRIALDDFVFHERLEELIRLADIIKVDVLSLDATTVKEHVERLRRYDVKLLAEKIETHEQFFECKDLGFEFFQGYFACRPQIVAHRTISPHRLGTLQLLSRLQDENLSIVELEKLISRDPSLCLKLLRFINSSHCGLRRKVDSIRHAATLVGLRQIRAWAGLLAFGDLNDKPNELVRTANIRARMCERLAAYVCDRYTDRCFTVGLFSLLDAFTDQPLDVILKQLPLSEEINTALLAHDGYAGAILRFVVAYEKADWKSVDTLNALGIPVDVVRNAYLEAIAWTDTLLVQMQV